MRYLWVILMLACATTASAGPTIFKCESGGKVVYQGTECDVSKASKTTATAPGTLHNGATDADPKQAYKCMKREARRNNVPLTAAAQMDTKQNPLRMKESEWREYCNE